MKRIIFLILTLCTLLTFTACSCGACKKAEPSYDGAYFLRNYKEGKVANVLETAEYSVKFKEETLSSTKDKVIPNVTGSLVTELSTEVLNEIKYYKFKTTLTLVGTYTFNEQVHQVNDVTTSTVWFLGKDDFFRPLKTEKSVKCLTPFVEKQTNTSKVVFNSYDFTYTIDYSGANAKINLTDNLKTENLEIMVNKFFSKTFCENELLIFYPRLFNLNQGFSRDVKTITLNGAESLKMSISSYNADVKATFNGKEKTVKTDVIQYYLPGDYPGAPLNVYLANFNDNNSLYKAPIKIEKPITLVGTQQYDLVSFTHNEI